MTNLNTIALAGRISTKFARTYNGKTQAQFSVAFNRAMKGEDPIWEYLPITVESDTTDFKEFDQKRVALSGFISGDYYVPKGSEKEVTSMKIIVKDIRELAKGEKADSGMTLTSRLSFTKEFGQNGASAQMNVRVRKSEKDEYRYVHIQVSGSRTNLPDLQDGEIVTIKGYLTGNPYTPKDSDKEVVAPKFVGMEILEREMPDASNAPAEQAPAGSETPDTTTAPAQEKPAVEEEDDDNIPF